MRNEEKKKEPITMVTMSEAAWDRNEERHRREKKYLVIALVAFAVLFAISTAGWIVSI